MTTQSASQQLAITTAREATQSRAPAVQQMAFQDMVTAAKMIAQSRLFKGWDTTEKVMSLMLLCQSEGVHPAQAVQRYDNIEGRVFKRSIAMLEDFIADGGQVEWLEVGDRKCKATFTPPGGKPLTMEYTWQEVIRAGNENKTNYRKYPGAMLRARLQAAALRMVWPKSTGRMYAPEEMDMVSSAEVLASLPSTDNPPALFEASAPGTSEATVDVDVSAEQPTDGNDDASPSVEQLTVEELVERDGVNRDSVLAFLRHVKWIGEDQDIADLAAGHHQQIVAGWNRFKAKVAEQEGGEG